MDKVKSPCVGKCSLNDDSICLGCLRSLNEIMEWGEANNTRKQEILINIKQRQE